VVQPPGPGSDLDQDLVYHVQALPVPFATDLQGNVEWYYDVQQSGLGMKNFFVGTVVPDGTVLGIGQDQYSVRNNRDVLREIDLAGNPVRETNLAEVNAQLAALGFETIYGFHHDVQRLPNGATVVPAFIERTININGTPTNYAADMIVVLDKNFQVSWAWDPFDHLDVHRGPFLPNPGEPPPSVPNLPAVEWLHTNAVSWSPADQNLVVSMRYQNWVVKIDYANGTGDGHVIWRLGQGGDFTVNSTDPNPWFSHQHDAHYIDNSTLILFDNGNGRRASDPTANSRGQVWKLDETTMTATLVVNVDLGNYSPMFGAAERLSNGDYSFTSGAQGTAPNLFGQTIEVRPDGSKAYVLQVNKTEYRSFRIRTLYEGVSDQLAGQSGQASLAVSQSSGPSSSAALRALTQPDSADIRRLDEFWAAAPWSLADLPRVTLTLNSSIFDDNLAVGGSLGDGGNAIGSNQMVPPPAALEASSSATPEPLAPSLASKAEPIVKTVNGQKVADVLESLAVDLGNDKGNGLEGSLL
jgi:hypothetical protein